MWVNGLINIVVGQHHGTSGNDRSSTGWRRRRLYLCGRRLKRERNERKTKQVFTNLIKWLGVKESGGTLLMRNAFKIYWHLDPRPTFAKEGPVGGNVCD